MKKLTFNFFQFFCFLYLTLALHVHPIVSELCLKNGARILRGQETEKGEFPYQLHLKVNNDQCGAIIIGQGMALTAAHCIFSSNLFHYKVTAGKHNFRINDVGQQSLTLSEIFVHPQYNQKTLQNDIAFLLLDGMTLNEHVKKINLPKKYPSLPFVPTAIGWGGVKFIEASGQVQEGSAILQKANLPMMPNANCQKIYPNDTIDSSVLCAGGKDSDTCKGDSGGPLVIKEFGAQCEDLLVGITSWGTNPCGRPGRPGVFTNVTHYMGWINSVFKVTDCGGWVDLESGHSDITYHNNGDRNVQNSCTWVISGGKIQGIGMTLTKFDLNGLASTSATITVNELPKSVSEADKGREMKFLKKLIVLSIVSMGGQKFGLNFKKINLESSPPAFISTQFLRNEGDRPQIYSYPPRAEKEYPVNVRHAIVLEGIPGHKISVLIKFVHMESTYDTLKVYKLTKTNDPKYLLDRTYSGYMGQLEGAIVESEVNRPLVLIFESDGSVGGQGFKLLYAASETSESCGGSIVFSGDTELEYENSREDHQEETCMWIFTASTTGPLTFNPLSFNLGHDAKAPLVSLHHYKAKDGLSTPTTLGLGEVGTNKIWEGSVAILTTVSKTGQGFRLKVSGLGQLGSSSSDKQYKTIILKPSTNFVTKYAYPSEGTLYSPLEDTNWIIKAHPKRRIRLTIDFVSTEPNYDYLLLHQFSKVDNKFIFIRKFTGALGQVTNAEYEGEINEPFYLNFVSDDSVQLEGFKIFYEYVY